MNDLMKTGVSLKDRPGTGSTTTTPMADAVLQVFGGGLRFGNVALTNDQLKAVRRLYGYVPEPPIPTPEVPAPPPPLPFCATYAEEHEHRKAKEAYETALHAQKNWSPQAFHQAGTDRNNLRCAEMDGLRLLVWLAKYVEPGQDPIKLLIQLASAAGYDVDPEEYAWATSEEDAAEEEES